MNDYIEKSLKTWYPKEHELHYDALHPAIKLAGEAGELLNLYGKHRFKPGFDWWNCKYCGLPKKEHDTMSHYHNNLECLLYCPSLLEINTYTPLVLDELGDYWYYWRVLAYLEDLDIDELKQEYIRDVPDDMLMFLAGLNLNSAKILRIYELDDVINIDYLRICFSWFEDILLILDTTLDELTELNYVKLNSDRSNHGWKDANKNKVDVK